MPRFYPALFAVLSLAARTGLVAQQPEPRLPPPVPQVSVSAEGSVRRQPDRAVLNIAVETRGETARAAADRNAERMDALVKAVKAAGITAENVHTVSYQLNPQYSYP